MNESIRIERTLPVYLLSHYNNIPKGEGWNASVVDTLSELEKDIASAPFELDEIDVDRTNSFEKPLDAYGSIGFACPAPREKITDYYYILFEVEKSEGEEAVLAPLLLKELARYIEENHNDMFVKCKLDDSEDLSRFILKAYFIKSL